MKKIILALAIAAAACMTIVGYASAGVERCEALRSPTASRP